MTGCTPVSTPLPANSCFQPATPDEHSKVSSYPYLEVLGSLTYVAMGMHPDISYAVRSLAPYASNFGHVHINRLKHVMRYLTGCPKHGILYTRGGGGLIGYTDADWASDQTNHRSVSGYAFLYSGGVVSWMSKQQSMVATSSTHAEYIAGTEASKELVWLRRLLLELREDVFQSTPLHIDNRAADLLARNLVNHAATKHIDVRYHFIRECISDSSIDLRLIGTNDMVADLLPSRLHGSSTNASVACLEWKPLTEDWWHGHRTVGECWSCSPPSMTSGVVVPSTAIGGTSAGSDNVLDTLLFSWQATGAVVSFYFRFLFERLRVDSNTSEVRTQLTVGVTPQYRTLTLYKWLVMNLGISQNKSMKQRK